MKQINKYLLIFSLFLLSCYNNKIKEGKITFMSYIPPHEEDVSFTTVTYIGKTPIIQYHDIKQWIPDTSYYITFNKIINNDTIYREISVNKLEYYKYNISDSIKLK